MENNQSSLVYSECIPTQQFFVNAYQEAEGQNGYKELVITFVTNSS